MPLWRATGFHDPWYFLKRQVAWLGVGLLVMHPSRGSTSTDLEETAIPLLWATLLLVLVLIPSLEMWPRGNGGKFHLGPINRSSRPRWRIVPSSAAAYLTKKQDGLCNSRASLPPLIVIDG